MTSALRGFARPIGAAVCLAYLFGHGAAGAARGQDARAEQLAVRRVLPLLHEKCVPCHGRDVSHLQGGLDLRSRAALMRGGGSGTPGISPGQPDTSPLYLAVTRKHDDWSPMPPKQAERLTAEQVGWLRAWIAGGAPWPDATRARAIVAEHAERWTAEDGVPVKTSGGLAPEWTSRRYKPEALWAYQPVRKPALPMTGTAAIDLLIERRIPTGLTPSPPAPARTFIRRATFDLTGLPPTPEQVRAFETEFARDSDRAVRGLIERLLDSPHYGERMAQHWLDVVRYADSSGFANDYERGNAWRYRDYVVRSFNADKPFDQFIREQIAGDELYERAKPADRHSDLLIASGFLRMGPWELTGMEVARVARQRFLDDVTNSVGETFLAQSLQCARCHDHKFDPIPTRDYYAIQALFAATQLCERDAPFTREENTQGFEERRYLEARRAGFQETLQKLDETLLQNARAWFESRGKDPARWNAAVAAARANANTGAGRPRVRRVSDVFGSARAALMRQGIAESEFPPKLVGFTAEQFGLERVARKGLERLSWEMDRYEPFALAVYNGRTPDVKSVSQPTRIPTDRGMPGDLEAPCVLVGGDPFSRGARVQPGVLSVLAAVPAPTIPEGLEGLRTAFAEWAASPANPLTTRAIVNRIWMWHFGEPLAGNPNNFGGTGKRPTHPELLDWLAATFVEQGWSFKAMHRLILTSAAYRRGAAHPDRKVLSEKDPLGTSLAVFRPRRLSAEEHRDASLAVSGELTTTLGGIPNRPEINSEVALQPRQVMGTFATAWIPNPLPRQRHRRTLYALRLRGLADPALTVLNAPAPDFSCERRETSTVTPQVFALFNSRASHARALAMAARLLRETDGDESAIDRGFWLAFGRPASAGERADCLAHWRAMERIQAGLTFAATKPPLEVRREAIEENTGETFSFMETLHSQADFVADLEPADRDAHTRALADVCLVLLNANEFAYVD